MIGCRTRGCLPYLLRAHPPPRRLCISIVAQLEEGYCSECHICHQAVSPPSWRGTTPLPQAHCSPRHAHSVGLFREHRGHPQVIREETGAGDLPHCPRRLTIDRLGSLARVLPAHASQTLFLLAPICAPMHSLSVLELAPVRSSCAMGRAANP